MKLKTYRIGPFVFAKDANTITLEAGTYVLHNSITFTLHKDTKLAGISYKPLKAKDITEDKQYGHE